MDNGTKTIGGALPAKMISYNCAWAFDGSPLQIDSNPCYVDSMGEQNAEVSGEIDSKADPKDPCCTLERIPEYKRPDPSSFERWADLRKLAA